MISFIFVFLVISLSGIGVDGKKNLSLRDINDWRQIGVEWSRSIRYALGNNFFRRFLLIASRRFISCGGLVVVSIFGKRRRRDGFWNTWRRDCLWNIRWSNCWLFRLYYWLRLCLGWLLGLWRLFWICFLLRWFGLCMRFRRGWNFR